MRLPVPVADASLQVFMISGTLQMSRSRVQRCCGQVATCMVEKVTHGIRAAPDELLQRAGENGLNERHLCSTAAWRVNNTARSSLTRSTPGVLDMRDKTLPPSAMKGLRMGRRALDARCAMASTFA
jgi:hypothetical protein